jgi:hypothetical protein
MHRRARLDCLAGALLERVSPGTLHQINQKNDSMNLRYSSVNEGLSFERFGAALLESGSSSLVVAAFES